MSTEYASARNLYAQWGVDTDDALTTLARIPISLHCWQGDDVAGFEAGSGNAGSGCVATGHYPGAARNFDELTSDLEEVASLVPGPLRINLHATYATEKPQSIDRDALEISHFQSWSDWARGNKWGVDFNPTCFGHRMSDTGMTLAHRDPAVRRFWVDHCIACRRIGAAFGHELGTQCVTNIWIPDGSKDSPADRFGPRRRLKESLDSIFAADLGDVARWNRDTVESKLFGIGVESYTVGSHEFYLAYAAQKQIGYCLDAGHFHPTECVADKISSLLLFVPHLLLHVSRGVRWDSDHVVTLDQSTCEILAEVAQSNALDRIAIGMDFFDASINRIAAWVIGARNTRKALLLGLLQPRRQSIDAENMGNFALRLAILEDARSLPWGAVWREFCLRNERPDDGSWFDEIARYEKITLKTRD